MINEQRAALPKSLTQMCLKYARIDQLLLKKMFETNKQKREMHHSEKTENAKYLITTEYPATGNVLLIGVM